KRQTRGRSVTPR
ncbi:Acetate CoA-transferase subunit alpha, partial [Haemophilus influenzae]